MPEEDEPIIPLDRSFNAGGDGILSRRTPITFQRALAGLRKTAVYRVAMVRLKSWFVYTCMSTALVIFLYVQVLCLVGPQAFWVLIQLANGIEVSHSNFYALDGWITKHLVVAVGPSSFAEHSATEMHPFNITRTPNGDPLVNL